jgi:alcohol dehydrogenase (cytochrome c)
MRLRHPLAALVIALVAALLVVAAIVVVTASDALAWRTRVLAAKLIGKLPEIQLRDVLRWLLPGGTVYVRPLADNPNVHAAIKNILIDDASADRGARTFASFCAQCHGDNARGKTGLDLVSSVANSTDWRFFSAVKWGRAGTGMTAQPLSDVQIWETHAYLRRLARNSWSEDGDVATRQRRQVSVAPGDILRSSERPHEWLTYAGNYAGHRHSDLSQISPKNIGDLRVAWVVQLRSGDKFLEASPIVAGGLIYVTESPDGVVALDAKTGDRVWRFSRPLPDKLPLCCGAVNRGVAILGSSVYVGTLDARLVALDASTGRKRWEVEVAEPRDGYSMTGAPLALTDRVVVGVAGGEFGIRGFVAAFSPDDGQLLWKFFTVPAPGEPGSESWARGSWKTGGAPTWTTGAYDEKLDLVYWGVGNPAPVYQGDARTGDNLFSNSAIALEAKTGRLRWHFQFTPADEHDWDAVQQPVLAEIPWQGRRRSTLLWANRNGFFYALDRETGEFFFAKPFVKQTWAAGLGPAGRPIVRPEARPSRQGSLVWPSVVGGTNWWPPSYDRTRQLVYVPSMEAAGIFFREEARFEQGERFLGSSSQLVPNQPITTAIKAIDTQTGSIRWEARLAHGAPEVVYGGVGGVLSTAGGLVFVGYRDEFFAFDAVSGKELWRIRVGGIVNAAPVSFAVDGVQYVALMAGHSLFAFALPPGK